MTPLFPENDAPITMEQGEIGDCSLLAAIDCVTNYGPEGYNHFKSMFRVCNNGVEIHFRKNLFRPNLVRKINAGLLDAKYGFDFDVATNEDIFFIPEDRLKVIDEDPRGVTTNSLAVKIIERITTYYYQGFTVDSASQQKEVSYDDSLIVHDAEYEMKHPGFHSAQFIGALLGLETMSFDAKTIQQAIKLKNKDSRTAVYVAINTVGLQGFEGYSGYHALRLGTIYPSNDRDTDGYVFGLVDPHYNQAEKKYSVSVLKKQDILVWVFKVNQSEHALLEKLLAEDDFFENIHFDSFLIVIDDYKKIPQMHTSIDSLISKFEAAKVRFLNTGDQTQFKKTCSDAMQCTLSYTELCTNEKNIQLMDNLKRDIRLYAKQFGFTVGTNYNPKMFNNLQADTEQTRLPSDLINSK